jgi:hypothetical protein
MSIPSFFYNMMLKWVRYSCKSSSYCLYAFLEGKGVHMCREGGVLGIWTY